MYATRNEIKKLQIAEPINFENYLEKTFDLYFQILTGISRREMMELVRVEILQRLTRK